ncbi:MAG: hypothetical protein HOP11_05310 [Saprospiraceae bacterium]|nr:hypothetical protein [Saprospiraceae bacterium]
MGQQVWDMDDISGEHFTLGLYHGEETGSLMLYLNNDIFLIDFKILDNKTYNFFLGNEFMKLSINKISSGYEYRLEVDKETPTPLNEAVKKAEDEERNILLVVLIVLSVILAILFIYNYYARYRY